MPSADADLEDRLGHARRSPRRSCRPPARRAAAAAARCTAPGPPRPASGRRRRGRRPGVCSLSPSSRNSAISATRSPCRLPSRVARGSRRPAAMKPALVRWCRPSIRFSATVWVADSAMFWKARATPMPAIWSGPHLVQPVLAEADLPLGGLVDAGQDVEHRRLAGAVGADDAWIVPGSTVNDTSESALIAPNRTLTSSTSTARDVGRGRSASAPACARSRRPPGQRLARRVARAGAGGSSLSWPR